MDVSDQGQIAVRMSVRNSENLLVNFKSIYLVN